MPYALHEKHFANVIALPSNERLRYFLGRVSDWEQLWGMRNDEGWLVPVTPDGIEYFPVWPHPDFAQKTTDLRFPGHRTDEICLHNFMECWLPTLQNDDVKVAAFPNLECTFWVIDAGHLAEHLLDELKKYE
jgi:hypothetical protein